MKNIDKKRYFSLLIFCAVFLSNPNINVIDIMPDFVAWFILAKLFQRAADSAPYFEEARAGFVKLGWINLAKIPAFFLIITIRSKDTLDNNIFALFSLSFCAVELVFLLPAIKNLFTALFHLGERTEAASLITPIDSPFSKNRKISPDSLKECTYFFFICKGILNFIPDMFMLTKFSERGTPITISKYYPFVFLISMALSITVAVIWFRRIKRYALNVHTEDKFFEALDFMASENNSYTLEKKHKLRTMLFAMTMIGIASLLTVELSFDNWGGINILPHFIYGIFLIITISFINRTSKVRFITYLCGIFYVAASLISYILSTLFLSKYTYLDLLDSKAAQSSYLLIEVFGIIEFLFITVFLVLIMLELNRFIMVHTGIPTSDKRYDALDKDFHNSLKAKSGICCALGILAAFAKCVNLFLNSDVQVLFTVYSAISTSSVPWFNLFVQVTSIAYILYTFYFVSFVKDEVRNKYMSW